MDEGDVVVAGDHVPERRKPLFHTLDLDGVRQRVSEGFIIVNNLCVNYSLRDVKITLSQ